VKIVVDDKIPFIRGIMEPYAEVVYLPGDKIGPADVADADAIVTRTRTKCNESLLKGSQVKIIATATIGFDHIGVDCCNNLGIKWANAPGCNSGSVMQYLASAIAVMNNKMGVGLKGKTLGIVGVGNVGKKAARLGEAFDMKVLLNDPPREREEGSDMFTNLQELLAQSDILSINVPLIKEGSDRTFHLFDERTLSRMKSNAILINTSRGEVVESRSLLWALNKRKLAGTVLDVWENEPDIDIELLEKVDIATPHIAGYSLDGKANGTAMSVQALSIFFGWDLHQWTPDDVPLPENPLIEISASLDQEKILSETILKTYDVMEDDARLRARVDLFEHQRGAYPPRREFPAYTIKPDFPDKPIIHKLKGLGFNVLQEIRY
jgi:erythronate-4-phosphate dehydrogenase